MKKKERGGKKGTYLVTGIRRGDRELVAALRETLLYTRETYVSSPDAVQDDSGRWDAALILLEENGIKCLNKPRIPMRPLFFKEHRCNGRIEMFS